MIMHKRVAVLLAITVILLVAVGCGSDLIKMSIDKVGEAVAYNRSMTGVGDVFYNHIKDVIDFTDSDSNKIRYITNTLHYGDVPSINVTIQAGRYYEAVSNLDGVDICRGILVFLQFDSVESATAAISVIKGAMNRGRSADGKYVLNLFDVVQNKNDLMVYYLRDTLAEYELKRVFTSKDYVK